MSDTGTIAGITNPVITQVTNLLNFSYNLTLLGVPSMLIGKSNFKLWNYNIRETLNLYLLLSLLGPISKLTPVQLGYSNWN